MICELNLNLFEIFILTEIVKHVRSTDRFGKRYRNVQSVFTINNDEEEEEGEDMYQSSEVEDMLETGQGPRPMEKLRWTEVAKKAEIGEHFEGEEVLAQQDSRHVPCYIGLSRTHMHIFHKVDGEVGNGYGERGDGSMFLVDIFRIFGLRFGGFLLS